MDNPEIDKNGNKFWRNREGKYHRDHGPAIELVNGYKEYWINGIRYDSLEQGLMDLALK